LDSVAHRRRRRLAGLAFIRYPEAAAHLRALMREHGLPVPAVERGGPRGSAPNR
jgi:hypothetical protein